MAKLKEFYASAKTALGRLGIPIIKEFSGESSREILEKISQSPYCALCLFLEGYKPRGANVPAGVEGAKISVYFCASYELSDIEKETNCFDYLEKIEEALHGLRVEGLTLKASDAGFSLVERVGLLAYKMEFNF